MHAQAGVPTISKRVSSSLWIALLLPSVYRILLGIEGKALLYELGACAALSWRWGAHPGDGVRGISQVTEKTGATRREGVMFPALGTMR